MRNSIDSYSVVIPAYNGERWLGVAIDSVLNQTWPCDNLVVVDDGSTDTTGEIAQSYGGSVQLIRQTNAGVSAARNRGASATESRYLAFLDADDIWEPEKMEQQLAAFRGNPDLVLVHCGVTYVDAENIPISATTDGGTGSVFDQLLLLEPAILGGGSGVVIPRPIFEESGGFDERLSTSADWSFFLHVARLGPVGFVAKPLLRYRYHDGNMHYNLDSQLHDQLLVLKDLEADSTIPRRLTRLAHAQLHKSLGLQRANRHQRIRSIRHLLWAAALEPSVVLDMASRLRSRIRNRP